MRINYLQLKTGKRIDLPHKISVLVGPNNAGKSQTLKDIRCLMDRQSSQIKTPVILLDDNSCFDIPDLDTIKRDISISNSRRNVDHYTIQAIGSNLFGKTDFDIHMTQLGSYNVQGDNSRRNMFFNWFSKHYIALMDAETRLKLSSETNSFIPGETMPENLIQALFVNPELEAILQIAFRDAFQQDIKLDVSQLVKICIRVGDRVNQIPTDARMAYNIAKDIPKIDSQGDGFRSFAGIIIGLLICKNRIILLDEPEAFLHPAQAYFLGKWIGAHQELLGSQLLICTHSSNFLSGILTGTQELSVIRLQREGDTTNYNNLSPDVSKQLIGNPILSSQRVVEGIFHKGVVVCEADADRAIYQAVASIYHNSNREILFIHAHNKQTLSLVANILRNTGTPVAVIADIDILRPGKDLEDVYRELTGYELEQNLRNRQKILDDFIEVRPENEVLQELKQNVETFLKQLQEGAHNLDGAKGALSRIKGDTSKWSVIKRDGISMLDGQQAENANILISELWKKGVFVVPVGELEGWIDLGTHKKNKWIIPALETIYQHKASSQIVDFVGSVLNFFK